MMKMDAEDLSDSHRRIMNCFMIPSLNHLSLARIAISLWTEKSIINDIRILNISKYHKSQKEELQWWSYIVIKLRNKVRELPLPLVVIRRLEDAMIGVGNEILGWLLHHEIYIFGNTSTKVSIAVQYVNCIRWSPTGAIDYAKTAAALLRRAKFRQRKKNSIAAWYCLEDYVRANIPAADCSTDYGDYFDRSAWPMAYYWYHVIRQEPFNMPLDIMIRDWIFLASSDADMVYVKYLFNVMSDQAKELCAVDVIKSHASMELKCFILTKLKKEQQKSVFLRCRLPIAFTMLTSWFWDEYFLTTVYSMVEDGTDELYFQIIMLLMRVCVHRSHLFRPKYKYFMKQMWTNAPRRVKDYILREGQGEIRWLILSAGRETKTFLAQLVLPDAVQMKEILDASCITEIYRTGVIVDAIHLILKDAVKHFHLSKSLLPFKEKFLDPRLSNITYLIFLDVIRKSEVVQDKFQITSVGVDSNHLVLWDIFIRHISTFDVFFELLLESMILHFLHQDSFNTWQ